MDPDRLLRRLPALRQHWVIGVSAGAALLSILVYWPYFRVPAAYSDTWDALAEARRTGRSYAEQAAGCFGGGDTRPVACLIRIWEAGVIGLRPAVWLLGALLLLVVGSVLLVWILHACGAPWFVAGTAGAALIVLPSANAVLLWPINGAGLAVAGFLAFVALGIAALRPGARVWRRAMCVVMAPLSLAVALGSYEAIALLPTAAISQAGGLERGKVPDGW